MKRQFNDNLCNNAKKEHKKCKSNDTNNEELKELLNKLYEIECLKNEINELIILYENNVNNNNCSYKLYALIHQYYHMIDRTNNKN